MKKVLLSAASPPPWALPRYLLAKDVDLRMSWWGAMAAIR
jgi:hypothetical protein